MNKLLFWSFLLIGTVAANAQTALTVKQVYDFEIGDEYQIAYQNYPHLASSKFDTYSFHKVIDKYYSPSGDTLYFEEEIETKKPMLVNGNTLKYTTQISTDFRFFPNPDSTIFSLHKNRDTTITDASAIDTSYVSVRYGGRVVNQVEYYISYYYGYSYAYVEGFGGWYGNSWDMDNIGKSELIYFKKQDVIWGNRIFTGLEETGIGDKGGSIFPNPCSGQFTISLPASENGLLQIYDIHGRIAHEETVQNDIQHIISFSGKLNPGQYTVQFNGSSTRWTKLLMVE